MKDLCPTCGGTGEVDVIETRVLSVEQAKQEILDYYNDYKEEAIYPDDVADELGIDLKTAVQAAEELKEEGKLEVV